jgi:hypothetical protein
LFLQDIKTDAPIAVDIRMEDLCLECNLQNAKWLEHDRHFIVSLTGSAHLHGSSLRFAKIKVDLNTLDKAK